MSNWNDKPSRHEVIYRDDSSTLKHDLIGLLELLAALAAIAILIAAR